MINNRQNGRRRGRNSGAPRPNGGGGSPDRGNRLDNRARGNASQLHEKYKTLARDAQMQGDRVMTEYYLQFADHYFRVLSESRARFDEQRPPRDRYDGNDFDQDGDEDGAEDSRFDDRGDRRDQREQRPERNRPDRDRPERNERQDRGDRQERGDRYERTDRPERMDRNDRPERRERQPERGERETERQPELAVAQPGDGDGAREERPRRGRRPRAAAVETGGGTDERIEMDRLPPAFAPEPAKEAGVNGANGVAHGDGEADEAKPRRRVRRPRPEESAAADA